MNQPTYFLTIDEVREGADVSAIKLLECDYNANSDTAAAEIMSDILLSVAKHNNLHHNYLNANLYKTQHINSI